MAGQLLLSVADTYSTKNPQITLFNTKPTKYDTELRETFEVPFDNTTTFFGTLSTCTIPKRNDILTAITLRALMPPIYPVQSSQYVYPTPSSQVKPIVYADIGMAVVFADGTTLTANTIGNHYFSVGAQVILTGTTYSIFNLDGTYTIASVPTANSFTCSTTIIGISFGGKASSSGIVSSDVVSYFSTQNQNLWLNNLTNRTWAITGASVVGSSVTFTTSASSNFPVGTQLILNLPSSGVLNTTVSVTAFTDKTFTCTLSGFTYTSSVSDSVSLVVPPLQLTNRIFTSSTYTSISFSNALNASFWGFDARQGLSYSLPATPPWTYVQSGWINGFLPPSLSTWTDSVAHALCKSVRIMCGKQTIKEYTGEYLELLNDLTVPYENKAILKLLNGTLDQTQSTVTREYYVSLPFGTDEIPLCALKRQDITVQVEFEQYNNLSQNLNLGSGSFTDNKSYTTYNASVGILGGQPINVQTTFSYQQYIFIVTYAGQFIVYDTTKSITDPTSYNVITAFSVTSLFTQFCVLSSYLYIGLTTGYLTRIYIPELIQGNISSFVYNNYRPTAGSLTGTLVADFRYVYYAVSNTTTSNVVMARYDTTGTFTNSGNYTSFDFTLTFNSGVNGVYQFLSTGTQIIMLPKGATGYLYTYNLNSNFQNQWYSLNYSSYGSLITQGTVIGSTLYFISGNAGIITYTNSQFTTSVSIPVSGSLNNIISVGNYIYASTSSVAIQIDTGNNFLTSGSAPVPSSKYIFANGPRYVYMFSQDSTQVTSPTNVYRYDPYTPNTTLQASILVDYKSSKSKPNKAFVPLVQSKYISNMYNLDIRNPVKELWLMGATNGYQYSNLAAQSSLLINKEPLLTLDVGTQKYLKVIEPFETHKAMPIRNFSVLSFELDPESPKPNGTVNFSRVHYQEFVGGATHAWATTYNMLVIKDGVGGLMYNF